MGFRFRKSIKLCDGVKLNLSKTGMSWSVGTKGIGVNVGRGKVTGHVGIPGSGLSYSTSLNSSQKDTQASKKMPDYSNNDNLSLFLGVIILAIFVLAFCFWGWWVVVGLIALVLFS